MPDPTFFATGGDFRRWLSRHHRTASDLLVGFCKVGSGRPSLTWSESVDQALCFGWIDGVRTRRDATSYTIRFTPRRPTSTWSAINIAKMAELERRGLVRAAGRAAFARRTEARSVTYSYEQRNSMELAGPFLARFKARRPAWTFFQAQAPSYRKLTTFWVMGAKRDETRLSRLERLIEASGQGRRL